MLGQEKKGHPRLFKYAGPNCIIHENFIRETPISLDDGKMEFLSQRCIEGVPRDGILKCIQNSAHTSTEL